MSKPTKPQVGYNPQTGKVQPYVPVDQVDDQTDIGYDPFGHTVGPMLPVEDEGGEGLDLLFGFGF
ncbi:hypothetical protein FACS1894166_11340 [Bacilli bacterium]|nr:hypothetical protein FACS1894166_11340 [Bacilli bacterium]